MNKREFKPGCISQIAYPFICLNEPFVGLSSASISPFIGEKIPFVRNKGFNIVELIITLTIAGILVAVAAPAMQKFVSSNRLTSQVNDLMADINLAKSEAIKRAVTAGVCVTASGGSSCVASGNWANGWMVYYDNSGTKTLVKIHEALTGGSTLTAPGDEIVFSKAGLVTTGANWQFTITNPKDAEKRIVCISTTGRPALSAVNCT